MAARRDLVIGAAAIAHELSVSQRSLYRMIRRGVITPNRIAGPGSPLRVPRETIERLLGKEK